MSDLIDRQAAINALIEEIAYKPEGYWDSGLNQYDVEVVLAQVPSVDAVEVAQLNLQPTCNQLATDCISRQAAIKAIEELIKARLDWLTDTRQERQGLNAAMCAIGDLPSADAVEIVRCRDCKHNPNDTWFECPISHLPYEEDRWCWKGERKDG